MTGRDALYHPFHLCPPESLERFLARYDAIHFRDYMAIQLTPLSGTMAYPDRMGDTYPHLLEEGRRGVPACDLIAFDDIEQAGHRQPGAGTVGDNIAEMERDRRVGHQPALPGPKQRGQPRRDVVDRRQQKAVLGGGHPASMWARAARFASPLTNLHLRF